MLSNVLGAGDIWNGDLNVHDAPGGLNLKIEAPDVRQGSGHFMQWLRSASLDARRFVACRSRHVPNILLKIHDTE